MGCTRGGGGDAASVFTDAGLLYSSSAGFNTETRKGTNSDRQGPTATSLIDGWLKGNVLIEEQVWNPIMVLSSPIMMPIISKGDYWVQIIQCHKKKDDTEFNKRSHDRLASNLFLRYLLKVFVLIIWSSPQTCSVQEVPEGGALLNSYSVKPSLVSVGGVAQRFFVGTKLHIQSL